MWCAAFGSSFTPDAGKPSVGERCCEEGSSLMAVRSPPGEPSFFFFSESLEKRIRSGSGRSEGVERLGCPVVEGQAGRVAVAADCCLETTRAVLVVVVFLVVL